MPSPRLALKPLQFTEQGTRVPCSGSGMTPFLAIDRPGTGRPLRRVLTLRLGDLLLRWAHNPRKLALSFPLHNRGGQRECNRSFVLIGHGALESK